MSAIVAIKEKLEKYPQVKYAVEGNLIKIFPVNEYGFNVVLEEQNFEYTVFFEGWHEHFTSEQEALNCVAFGLSDCCRIKEISRGGKPHRWVVEHFNNGVWETDSETGLIVFGFWKKKTEKILQNNIIKSS
jgi:hypothetical protein